MAAARLCVVSDWFNSLVAAALPGSRIVESSSVPGGISGDTRFVRLETAAGEILDLVLKRPGARFGRVDPQRVACEFHLLAAAHAAGLPVARPVYLGDDALAMERLAGASVFRPADPVAAAERIAELAAALHLGFLGLEGRSRLGPALGSGLAEADADLEHFWPPVQDPDESLGETRIRSQLAAGWPPPSNPTTLLHGDMWPGNILWSEGRITGLIDWEDASLGDPLEDIGITRLDIWWQYGEAAMRAFTARYFALVPWPDTALPTWDLVAALRPCGQIHDWAHGLDNVPTDVPHITEEHMRAVHALFVEQAIGA